MQTGLFLTRLRLHLQGIRQFHSTNNWPLPRNSIPTDNTDIELQYYQPHNRIPESELKNNYLYEIRARNSCAGIYNHENRYFTIARNKCGLESLFNEYDWNTGRPYGTAVPVSEIELSPTFANNSEKLKYLIKWRSLLNE
jgi:hypothetical protein